MPSGAFGAFCALDPLQIRINADRASAPSSAPSKSALLSAKRYLSMTDNLPLRMRRLQLHRRSISNASQTETSTNPSLTSGSMDSYASQPSSTDATSDDAHKWKDLAGSAMLSPSEMSDGGATERQDSDPMHKTLRRIDTESKDKEGQGEVMFDSPTSDGEVGTPVMQSSK